MIGTSISPVTYLHDGATILHSAGRFGVLDASKLGLPDEVVIGMARKAYRATAERFILDGFRTVQAEALDGARIDCALSLRELHGDVSKSAQPAAVSACVNLTHVESNRRA